MSRFRHAVSLVLFALFSLLPLTAQETRSTIFGRVLDPQGAPVSGAAIQVRNADTGVVLNSKTNETGYYEANLLLPGNYELTAEFQGFKRASRKGIVLRIASRVDVDLPLELGTTTETVVVTAEAPMLETSSVGSGRVLDNQTTMALPVMGNSALQLVKLTPGIQTGGVNSYVAMHSVISASDYSVNGNVGGNTWTIDGSPIIGGDRHVAYLPYTDAVAEVKISTSEFDASIGQTSGAAIKLISKSGTNELHGTLTEQHWQQRWQGTPFFVKQNYYRRIAAAESAGNQTLADQIRNTDKQTSGRSNNWGMSIGGPLIIPKVYNGKDKLFWFFTYNGFRDAKTSNTTRTVPTENARNGDFSDLLSLPNSAKYVVYDPLTIAKDPARSTHYLRTPFAGNVVPKNRFVNPAYDAITKLYPLPNNPTLAGREPVDNYLAYATPFSWDYKALSNRVDYQLNDKIRMYGRWSWNDFFEDNGDWTYETARGLNSSNLVRNNKAATFDVVWTKSPSTILDFTVSANQFLEGNTTPVVEQYKPSDIKLPAYLDQKAADLAMLPQMAVSGYSTISIDGLQNMVRFRTGTAKAELTHLRGAHTLRAAFDTRQMFRTGDPLVRNTSGNFGFSNAYVKRTDDDTTQSNLGLGWAAFALGIPNSATIATSDNYATHTPYYASFFQDTWRATRKLTLTLGLRAEYEMGATERYNRMITGFDPTLTLPITALAQASYAALPDKDRPLPTSEFKIQGGTLFAGQNGQSRRLFKSELMWLPRFGAAYQLDKQTVLRAGYGIYQDTLNILNFNIDQSGFSRTTTTNLTNDYGMTWNLPANADPRNYASPLVDPFPVRSDGTRFDIPTQGGLGAMAKAGRGFTYTDYDRLHPRQQRWRASLQRQFGNSLVVEGAYAGSYSDRLSTSMKLDYLPEQYWASGLTRDNAIASSMNANVTNPFKLSNFASLQQSNPIVYQDMSTMGFYTSSTIQRHKLLRAFPQMNGLTNSTVSNGYAKTHEFDLSVEKRFSRSFNMNFGYTGMMVRRADTYYNEWDREPYEEMSNNGRPHRVVASSVIEMPFGKGRHFLAHANRALDSIAGGWQLAVTYEFQPGPLLSWGNPFYYGSDVNNILNVDRTWDSWFNTADFERNSSKGPAAYHRRVFPTRIPGLRADMTNQWNANLAKAIEFTERVKLQLRLDALNLQNRSQMNGPNTDPYSTNFGRITSQTGATNRWIQIQGRVTF